VKTTLIFQYRTINEIVLVTELQLYQNMQSKFSWKFSSGDYWLFV